ncbi:DUF2281 domain-containing protein [Microcoleus sp. ARI1-B5]|uniref:hypothetical protein n=1 Tax=unclassified Microcoleus TaxID=2642155 RepID=UPI002FD6127C
MIQSMNIEQTLLENLRLLPTEKQQEVLDFVQFLLYKAQQTKQLPNASSESSISPTEPPPLKRSLLDCEDYLIDPAITRSQDAFLKGCAPEDEGLYDDY